MAQALRTLPRFDGRNGSEVWAAWPVIYLSALRIFYQVFMFLPFGPATAMAWNLGAMLVDFVLVQPNRLSQRGFKSGFR